MRAVNPGYGWVLLVVLGSGCEGKTFSTPPLHPQLNMDFQKRFEAQEENPFYDDDRAMRAPPVGTVARGRLTTDTHLFEGRVEDALAVELPEQDEAGRPMRADAALLERGRERYDIFCTPCHGYAGDGDGLAVRLPDGSPRPGGMVQPPSLYDERLQGQPLGYFFEIISHGKNNMMPYRSQIPVRDRWAIAAYVRVLQRSRAATLDMVPAAVASERGWRKN